MFHKREVARRHESMRGLCAFIWFLFLLRGCDAAVDTITTSQPIPDGKTIISSDGTFEMGFFSPDGTSNRYLGIWYKKVKETTVVWIANRDAPLRDTDGVFKVTSDANLTLLDGSGCSLWSTNGSRLVENPIGQLLDSGNLVVRDASDVDPRNYVWQSFDYPTDTILPGMKHGLDLVKKIDRSVRSPKSSSDPSGGEFTFVMDPSGYPQELLLNGKDAVFRSGPWNGLGFSGCPGLKPNDLYTYEYVQTPEEIYYKFDLVNSSLYSRLTLTSDGVLRRLNWNYNAKEWTVYLNAPADNCDQYGLCQGNGICDIDNSPVCSCLDKFVPRSPDNWAATDWSAGCTRKVPVVCRKGDGFLRYGNVKLPDTRKSWYNESMSLRECEKLCESNCSCIAYSNTNISGKGSGCLLWFGDLMDMIKFSKGGQDIYIRLDSSEIGSGSYKAKIVGITLPLLGGFLLILILVLRRKIKKKKKQKRNDEQPSIEGTLMGNMSENFYTEAQSEDLELPFIDLQTVLKATNNLSFENKLGQGGFGLVYKGTLIDGKEIAVKRLSEFSIQGLEEFKNEVRCIAKLQHRNLVKLLGCCIQEEEKMLVYEFLPNKSLDLFIFDHYRSRLLDWPKRIQIISGIARGLLYLHQDSRLTIIHRDLKAANILLDIDMKPKISDFGMARIFGGSETEANNTKRVVGTYGYMSPEYAVDGYFSTKSDVFSFGVLVLEIVSGMKNRGFSHPDHHHNLLGHAWLLYKEDRSQELIDKNLILESCHLFEVMRSIHVALLCVQKSPDDRPSMSSVVLQLASDGALPLPKEPGFFTERDFYFEQDDPSSSTNRQDSSADYSITILEGR